MLSAQSGESAGSVSGGCVEAEVIEAARDCYVANQHKQLHYSVADETAWANGLSCGGEVTILCLPVHDAFISGTLLSQIQSAQKTPTDQKLAICGATGAAKLTTKSGLDGHHLFAIRPQRALIIIGAGHISQILAPMANEADFDVTLIDPRAEFLTKERFAIGTHHCGWPSDILTPDKLNAQTALVTLTHNPVIDDEALCIALASQAFHISALGSHGTHQKRLARLAKAHPQFDTASLKRIKGPAGLAIGAKTPAEIAVSILAEIIAAFSKIKSPSP